MTKKEREREGERELFDISSFAAQERTTTVKGVHFFLVSQPSVVD